MRLSALAVPATLFLGSALCATGAQAETFTFTATTNFGVTFSGTLNGVAGSTSGAYDITSATGNVSYSGGTIPLSLYGAGSNGSPQTATVGGQTFTYDDVVYTNGTPLDQYGLLFSDGGDNTQIGFNGGSYYFSNDSGGPFGGITSFTLTDTTPTSPSSVTPEPSSFALLGTGLLGVAGTLKRRYA